MGRWLPKFCPHYGSAPEFCPDYGSDVGFLPALWVRRRFFCPHYGSLSGIFCPDYGSNHFFARILGSTSFFSAEHGGPLFFEVTPPIESHALYLYTRHVCVHHLLQLINCKNIPFNHRLLNTLASN